MLCTIKMLLALPCSAEVKQVAKRKLVLWLSPVMAITQNDSKGRKPSSLPSKPRCNLKKSVFIPGLNANIGCFCQETQLYLCVVSLAALPEPLGLAALYLCT